MSTRETIHALMQRAGLPLTGISENIDTFGENNNEHSRLWVNYAANDAYERDMGLLKTDFIAASGDSRQALNHDVAVFSNDDPGTASHHSMLEYAKLRLHDSDDSVVLLGGKILTIAEALTMFDGLASAAGVIVAGGQLVMHPKSGVVKYYSQDKSMCIGLSLRYKTRAFAKAFASQGEVGRQDVVVVVNRDATLALVRAVEQLPELVRKRRHYEDTINTKSHHRNRFTNEADEIIGTALRNAASHIGSGQTVNAHIAFQNVTGEMRPAVLSMMQAMENAGKPITIGPRKGQAVHYPSAYFVPTGQPGIWRRTSTAAA